MWISHKSKSVAAAASQSSSSELKRALFATPVLTLASAARSSNPVDIQAKTNSGYSALSRSFKRRDTFLLSNGNPVGGWGVGERETVRGVTSTAVHIFLIKRLRSIDTIGLFLSLLEKSSGTSHYSNSKPNRAALLLFGALG